MQSKGVVKFFLIFIVLVTAIQYLYILPTQKVEKNAEEYAVSLGGDDQSQVKALRTAYLDSMSSEVIFELPFLKKFTYQDLKARQLALGLDLKGGMSVVLQVDLKEFILALSNNNSDPTFVNSLENAQKRLASEQTD